MWDKIISVIDAFIVHIILLAILLLSFQLPDFPASNSTSLEIVNENAVLAEMERLKRENYFNQSSQQAQQYVLKQKQIESAKFVEQEQAYLETLRQQQQEQQEELETLKQRRLEEQQELESLTQRRVTEEEALKKLQTENDNF